VPSRGNAGNGGCLRLFRMIGIEIEKRDQFREQSMPMLSQIEGQEIESAHKSVVSPCCTMLHYVHFVDTVLVVIMRMAPFPILLLPNNRELRDGTFR